MLMTVTKDLFENQVYLVNDMSLIDDQNTKPIIHFCQ